jgi:hypothetical protein
MLRWWSRAVNRCSLLSFAAFRTPFSPWDTRFPLCVGCMCDGTMFSFVCALPSTASAEGRPSFHKYYGPVRLLQRVHVRRAARGLRTPLSNHC